MIKFHVRATRFERVEVEAVCDTCGIGLLVELRPNERPKPGVASAKKHLLVMLRAGGCRCPVEEAAG